jgi:hypothetical protein
MAECDTTTHHQRKRGNNMEKVDKQSLYYMTLRCKCGKLIKMWLDKSDEAEFKCKCRTKYKISFWSSREEVR